MAIGVSSAHLCYACAVDSAADFYFLVFCHEIAHNGTAEHDETHISLLQGLAAKHLFAYSKWRQGYSARMPILRAVDVVRVRLQLQQQAQRRPRSASNSRQAANGAAQTRPQQPAAAALPEKQMVALVDSKKAGQLQFKRGDRLWVTVDVGTEWFGRNAAGQHGPFVSGSAIALPDDTSAIPSFLEMIGLRA